MAENTQCPIQSIPELCTYISVQTKGAHVSLKGQVLAVPVSAATECLENSALDTSTVALWPQMREPKHENIFIHGLYTLGAGADDSSTWRISSKGRTTISDGTLKLRPNECLLLGPTSDCLELQNLVVEGGVIICQGPDCKIALKQVQFKLATLVVAQGASVTIRECSFTAEALPGAGGISMLAHGKRTRVCAVGCSFTGGWQHIAVHAGASFEGQRLESRRAGVIGIEAKDPSTTIATKGMCTISDIDQHESSEDPSTAVSVSQHYRTGILVHSGALATISSCTVGRCGTGMHVSGSSTTCMVSGCHTSENSSAGFFVTDAATLSVRESSSHRDSTGCRSVGDGTQLLADGIQFDSSLRQGLHVTSGKGSQVELRNCSAINCDIGLCFWGVLGGEPVLIQGGEVKRNRHCGVMVSDGAHAVLRSVRAEENGLGEFVCDVGSTLELWHCRSSTDTAYKQLRGGTIQLHTCRPGSDKILSLAGLIQDEVA